ncbi:MAG: hypothetical protein SFW67_02055 [Myxococcaceae bacterium]|nr:hypothetical protein [Myxococcaceae bacterium]
MAVDSTLIGRRLANVTASFEPGVFARWWFSPHWGATVRLGARFDSSPTLAQASVVDALVAGLPSVAGALQLDVRP